MKCRGCGDDTNDYESPGLGWIHWKCEVKRLSGLLDEEQSLHRCLTCSKTIESAFCSLSCATEYLTAAPEPPIFTEGAVGDVPVDELFEAGRGPQPSLQNPVSEYESAMERLWPKGRPRR